MSVDIHTCPHCGQHTHIDTPAPDVAVGRITPYSPHSSYDARTVCEGCNESLGVYYEAARSSQ